MKFSSKVLKCGLSPMRKFHPYAVAAEAKGRKIYHLNIGQPDIETPKAYFDAVKHFDLPVLAYAPSPGIPELIEAIRKYYADLGMHFDAGDILITNGGSEALQITMNCILDDGDEILIPEPFYPNYNTMAYTCGAKIHPIPTSPHDGYHYADRAKVEAEINEHTRAIMVTNPGNPTGAVLTPEEMRMLVDVAKAHDLFIIGDEAYREFVYAGEPLQSMGQFEDAAENVIVIDTVSKRFSACGARIGCMISRNKELMAQAMKYAQCRLSVPTLDQVAAAALYTVGPDYFAAVRLSRQQARDNAVNLLQEAMSYSESSKEAESAVELEQIVQTALSEAQIESLIIAVKLAMVEVDYEVLVNGKSVSSGKQKFPKGVTKIPEEDALELANSKLNYPPYNTATLEIDKDYPDNLTVVNGKVTIALLGHKG